jgi:hypothetical protein
MSSKAFTAQIFRWLHQVNGDPELPASAASIAIYLSGRFNEEDDGEAWPGFDKIAEQCHLSKSVVVVGLRKMVERGHLRSEPGRAGRGHSTRYWMVEKGRIPDLFEQPKRSEKKVRNLSEKVRNPDMTLSKTQETAKAVSLERESRALARSSDPDPGEPLDAAPGFEGELELLPPSPIPVLDHERVWRELREAWQRPHAEDQRADRKAFDVACREAAPEDIIAAARVWVAAYAAGDGVRYLPKLAKWLGDHGWQKDPPPPKRGGGKRRSNGKAKGAAAYLLEDDGYTLDDDGKWRRGGSP